MDLGFILVTGLLTSFHCVAMCGTMVATYAIGNSASDSASVTGRRFEAAPHLIYQSAKLLSYTAVGFVLGAVGQALNLGGIRGTASLLAGAFMVLLGLNMLNVHPVFRLFSLRMPRRLQRLLFKDRENAGRFGAPAVFGLLTGFMPCGPLQAMQLYAAGTGSAIKGAAVMLLFGAMTAPTMLVFGAATQALGHAFKRRVMAVGALVVMGLGVIMFDRGLNLAGSALTLGSMRARAMAALGLGSGSTGSGTSTLKGDVQEATIVIENSRYVPDVLTLAAGVPVRLTIDRREAGACSDEFVIPAYGVQQRLAPNGKTVVEFTPDRAGTVPFTCQMGMMSGTFLVTTDAQVVVSAGRGAGAGGAGSGAEAGGAGGTGGAGRAVDSAAPSAEGVAANRILFLVAVAFLGLVGYRGWSMRVATAGAVAGGAVAGRAADRPGAGGARVRRGARGGGAPKRRAARPATAQPHGRELVWIVIGVVVAVLAGYSVGTYQAVTTATGGQGAVTGAGGEVGWPGYDPGAYAPAAPYADAPLEGSTRTSKDGKSQAFLLNVVGTYQPPRIRAKAGVPLSLTVERHESNWCSKYLVFPGLGIQKELPDDGTVTIEVPALRPGRYRFTCQMNMLAGELLVQ